MTETPAAITHSIDIRPDVSVYATYRRLSYQPWFAIAEFVDNSTQNYYNHRTELLEAYKNDGGIPGKLVVEIAYDSENNSLTIHDNANGMNLEELNRAVVLNKPPPDRSGRCEYGMGLKTAACWFGKSWEIDTVRLGSGKRYRVLVDVEDLAKNHSEAVQVNEFPAKPNSHSTKLTIKGLYKPLKGKTHERIRDQLGSMYRTDLRSRELDILWSGMPISFEEPTFLKEPNADGETKEWKKNVSFHVPWEAEGKELQVDGWIGVRMPGKQRDAGFVLMRRGRVIIGGPNEGYKPIDIFGQPNSFSSQRLVGELNLDAWPVTQAKDDFDWSGGLEDCFIKELENNCREYMDKAEAYREKEKANGKEEPKPSNGASPPSVPNNVKEENKAATNGAQITFSEAFFGNNVSKQPAASYTSDNKPVDSQTEATNTENNRDQMKFSLDLNGTLWNFVVNWLPQSSDVHWMQINYADDKIEICLNSTHSFFEPYLEKNEMRDLIHKFILSLALAEKMARLTSKNGLIEPGDIRAHMNKLLKRTTEIKGRP